MKTKKKAVSHEGWQTTRSERLNYYIGDLGRTRGGRKFCVSDFRQSQEFLVENTHYLAYFPCPPCSPAGGAAVCAPRAE